MKMEQHVGEFSLDRELKNADDDLLHAGLLAVYPEDLAEVRGEKREDVLKSGIEAVERALSLEDFAKAQRLITALQKAFTAEAVKERLASHEYISQTPTDSPDFEKARKLFKEKDWEVMKEKINFALAMAKNHNQGSYYYDAISYMKRMCLFDSKRFNKEVKIPDKDWAEIVKYFEPEQTQKFYGDSNVLPVILNLRMLAPTEYKNKIKMHDKDWAEVKKILEKERERKNLIHFVDVYYCAYIVDPTRIQKLIPIDKELWKQIRVFYLRMRDNGNNWRNDVYSVSQILLFMKRANTIRPADVEPLNLTEKRKQMLFQTIENMNGEGFWEANLLQEQTM